MKSFFILVPEKSVIFQIKMFLTAIMVATTLDAFFSPESGVLFAQELIVEMEVKGNAKVEADAIVTILKSRKGDILNPEWVKEDIKSLFELGYFSDIRFLKENLEGGIKLIISVVEKPAITSITFAGMQEVTETDLKDKLETKLYTIVNEGTITKDLATIEKAYLDKGFYLARATYNLEKKSETEVGLQYIVDEGGKLQVGDVSILGNEYFSDTDLISKMFSRPLTRISSFSSTGSMYQDEFVKRDLEILSFLYRDQGFAKVKVAKPLQLMDPDRAFVRLTYQVEEGLQYSLDKIDISGDVLFPVDELKNDFKLKPKELFRISFLQKDVEYLVDKYGDLGYAFVNVDPKITYDDERRTVAIDFDITKGEKVYFGSFNIIGNSKTRDNVIRREFEVADSELYSGTGLTKSKRNMERLGYFEESQTIRQRDDRDENLLNYKVKVKEKPTGQLNAAIGFQPAAGNAQNNWFGQGSYREENQSGKGWKTGLSGRWNGEDNYQIDASFTEPRINDSYWSLGLNLFLKNNEISITNDVGLIERRVGASTTLGRKIIEMLQGTITYRIERVSQKNQEFILPKFKEEGLYSSVIFGLSRNTTNNYLDPSEGSNVALRQKFTGGSYLGGDYEFRETSLDAALYIPFDFTDTYRTSLKFRGLLSYIYPATEGKAVPFLERYRLGGPDDLRGYDYRSLGPSYSVLNAPGDPITTVNYGGDKQLVLQAEYFLPLIPEAGIKAVFFGDAGRVYDENQNIEMKDFHYDFGFGFRWITPIAPFRFEWAYPIIDGKRGDLKFVFYLGY